MSTDTDLTEGLPAETVDAARLAHAIWRNIASEQKRFYRERIWEQFESALRGSARTSPTLRLWLERASQRLHATTAGGADAATVVGILAQGQDAAVLRVLREETSTVVTIVRYWSQERRKAWEQRQQQQTPEPAPADPDGVPVTVGMDW